MPFDLDQIIKEAKLGRSRKDAQIDACAVFAAALYDVLESRGISSEMVVVEGGFSNFDAWAHSVVHVDGRYYDSMGEFSESIWRTRSKIHPKVTTNLKFKPDTREEVYEREFDGMHEFFLKMLTKALDAAPSNEDVSFKP